MFEEIDYILEGQNAERFASLYADNYSKCFQIMIIALNYLSYHKNLY